MWVLVPCLAALRRDITALAPGRDTSSDGAIGDAAHLPGSDHTPDEDSPVLRGRDPDRVNEVHAVDVDASGPWPPGWSMERVVRTVVTRHRDGQDDRLQNVIYDRRIWSRSWGWTSRDYTGPSPHTEHAHFSARYTDASERDTSSWGLSPEGPDMTKAELLALLKDADIRAALCSAVLTTDNVLTAPPSARPDTHWSATSYLQQTYGAALTARNGANALIPLARAEAAEVPPTAAQTAAAVLAGLADPSRPDEEVAAALRTVLGSRAAEVGRLLVAAVPAEGPTR